MKRWIVEVHTENRSIVDQGTVMRYDSKPFRVENMVVDVITELTEHRLYVRGWFVDGIKLEPSKEDLTLLSMPIPHSHVAEAAKRAAEIKHPSSRTALVKGAGVQNFLEPVEQRYTVRVVYDAGEGEEEGQVVVRALSEDKARELAKADVFERLRVEPYVISVLKIENIDTDDVSPPLKVRKTLTAKSQHV